MPQQPVMQVRGKAVFGAVRECQRKCPQLACCPAFRLFSQVANDDFDPVKPAHLHRDAGESLQQPAAPVADNALYQNDFFLQCRALLPVAFNRLVLDFEHRRHPLADGVIQHHDAPFPPEVAVSTMRLTAACGVAQVVLVAALARWRRMVLRLHPCCSASCVAVRLPSL